MRRLIVVTSTLLTLGFGSFAQASPPPIVVEAMTVHIEGAGTTLRFVTRFAEEFDTSAFPETGSAVVMQPDGQRAKCLNVPLVLTNVDNGRATYVGKFNFIYRNGSVLTGRADIMGQIFDFSAPLDATPGKVVPSQASTVGGTAPNAAVPAIVITPQPAVITPDPATIDPRTAAATAAAQAAARSAQGASAPGTPTLVDGIAANTMPLLGLIVVAVAIVSAYFDRKRSLARTAAS